MGEGCTPLLRRTLHGAPALLKCEWFMPTGSFKDRGASVMLSLLRAQGIRDVLEDSSGNGGAAVSAYAAAGGMQATIMAPASTSPAKTVQMRAHGATVELIPGTRQDTADAAVRRSETIVLCQPQLAPVLPARHQDAGLRAVGGPGLPRARQRHHAVRRRIERAGLRDRLFRTAARRRDRQPCRASSPPSRRIAGRSPRRSSPAATCRSPPRSAPTIAEGTAIAQPIRLAEVLGTLRETRGGAVMLTEEEIGAATLDLARIGIYVEPTSAQAAAAFRKLLAAGTITPEQTTVLVLTGSGLKATPRIAELLGMRL